MSEDHSMYGVVERVRMTYDDLLALPDDGMRHELIDGEHFVSPAPSWMHQHVTGKLFQLIANHAEAHRLGVTFFAPLDVVFTPYDVVEPDVLFFTPEGFRAHIGDRNAEGPPDLAVEVVSPSSRRRDEQLKRRLYEQMGVGEYWIVDPERQTIDVLRRRAGRYESSRLSADTRAVLRSPLFPGLDLPLTVVFADPLSFGGPPSR